MIQTTNSTQKVTQTETFCSVPISYILLELKVQFKPHPTVDEWKQTFPWTKKLCFWMYARYVGQLKAAIDFGYYRALRDAQYKK